MNQQTIMSRHEKFMAESFAWSKTLDHYLHMYDEAVHTLAMRQGVSETEFTQAIASIMNHDLLVAWLETPHQAFDGVPLDVMGNMLTCCNEVNVSHTGDILVPTMPAQ